MGYIDSNTDVIVVAGGDGTLIEVVNGLMRRHDAVSKTMCCGTTSFLCTEIVFSIQGKVCTIPIGVLPLGKENRFYKSSPLSYHYHKSPAR